MSIDKFHASHIKKVEVDLVISSTSVNPDEITEMLGLEPDESAKTGDERKNPKGILLSPHKNGFWKLTTKGKINSKDINDHYRFLLDLLLPHTEAVQEIARKGDVFFNVYWVSSYLYAGTGPLIDKESCAGIAQLNASIGFDIYQVDDEE